MKVGLLSIQTPNARKREIGNSDALDT